MDGYIEGPDRDVKVSVPQIPCQSSHLISPGAYDTLCPTGTIIHPGLHPSPPGRLWPLCPSVLSPPDCDTVAELLLGNKYGCQVSTNS